MKGDPGLRAEALIHLPVVEQVTDPVHGVLEEGSCGEDDHPNCRFDEWQGVEGGDETGELADVAEILDRFHGVPVALSTAAQLPDHGDQ